MSLRLLAAADDQQFEQLMRHVQLANGVYRTTFRNRFHNLDPVVNEVLRANFRPQEKLLVEDWAASACLTSYEWAQTLLPLFPGLRFTASDVALFLIEVEDRRSGDIFIADQDGRLLQFVRPPFVVSVQPPEPWYVPVNRLLCESAKTRWQKSAGLWPLPAEWLDARGEAALVREPYVVRKLPLVHPNAMALARSDARFSICRHSVFERSQTPCHVIRSMNILNRAYFSEVELTQAARAVIGSLRTHGIWVVGRTIDDESSVHDASVFRKGSSGELELISRMGNGAEIERLALDLTLATR
ncbi:MAG: hypothetical protein JO319_03185 [Acidobacteriaceae bacterium]|nr:hypothetical protein [Acidobacteriaceae bacterium]